jgi:hypothetical protein
MVHAGGLGNATAEVIEPLLDYDLRWYCENIATVSVLPTIDRPGPAPAPS